MKAHLLYATEYAVPLRLGEITAQPIANKLLDIGVNCGDGVAEKFAQVGVTLLGAPVAIDGHLGPASIAAINKVDADRLMDRLISLSVHRYQDIAAEGKATPEELESWLTRAKKPGI